MSFLQIIGLVAAAAMVGAFAARIGWMLPKMLADEIDRHLAKFK